MKIYLNRVIASLIFIGISPFLFIIYILNILDTGTPAFFKQKRIGLNNSTFLLYKFRTMKNNTPDIPTHLIKDSQNNYTFLGPLFRKLSIDELPQLVNIIKGEMVFVGPRPALHNQDDLVKLRTEVGIHKLMPGVTGWAQVNGRDLLSIQDKVKCDKYYLDNQSFFLDMKIIFITTFQIFNPKGISQ